jgi:hypothetical protein
MENLVEENLKLKEKVQKLKDDNNELIEKYINYRNRVFNSNIIKIHKITDLSNEKNNLIKKLEEKNIHCLKEKEDLRQEIIELKKLVDGIYDSKRKKTENSTYCH